METFQKPSPTQRCKRGEIADGSRCCQMMQAEYRTSSIRNVLGVFRYGGLRRKTGIRAEKYLIALIGESATA